MHWPTHQVNTPIRSSDGQNLICDNTSILARWSEHFQSLFSANRNMLDNNTHRIFQLPLKPEIDEPPILKETIEVIARHRFGDEDPNGSCLFAARHCRQPKLPSFLYSSNTTSWRLMRRANNNNNRSLAVRCSMSNLTTFSSESRASCHKIIATQTS